MIHHKIIILSLALFASNVSAQDNHFSHYENAPQYINPATTGVFIGNSRLITSYREQWDKVLAAQKYKTAFVSFDSKINADCKKDNFFSVGGYILADEVSALHFKNIQISPAVSYQVLLQKTNRSELSLVAGTSLNITNQRLDYSDARWGEQIVKGVFNPALPVNEPQFLANGKNQQTDFDPSVGVMLFKLFDIYRFNAMYLGFSMHHITKPSRSFINDPMLPYLSSRYVLQLGGEIEFRNARIGLSPDLLASIQGNIWQINTGFDLNYRLGGSRRDINHIRVGGHIRSAYKGIDAFIISGGYDHESIGIGFSYDINTSMLAIASRGRGALEMSVRYRFSSNNTKCNVGCPSKKF